MTFPDTPLDLRAELNLGGTWTDLSAYLDHGPVSISRGHPDESTTVSPSTLGMTLTDATGNLSPDNPVSPYWPWLSLNVPCRVSVPAQVNYLRLETDRNSSFSCPDSSGLHITGDIDVRVDARLTNWTGSYLAGKWINGGAGSQQCWLLQVNHDGTVQFFWSTTGSDFPSAGSTLPLPSAGRQVIRATLAVSTGTVTFYTAAAGNADTGPFTQLGAAVVTGATSIFAGTAAIAAGNQDSGGGTGMYGNVYELEVRSGIAGTVKAHPVFSAQTAGTTSFTDAQSNTWTLNGAAEISSRSYRGHFELAAFPQKETPYNPGAGAVTDALVEVQGGGLLRRASQRNNPLSSAMYRAWTRFQAAPVAAYWPMEDGAGSAQISSGDGGKPMYFGGSPLPNLAANSDFACSNPLPVVNGAAFTGAVSYSGTWTDNQVAFLLEIPAAAEADEAVVTAVYSTGTVALMTLRYRTAGSGSLELFGFNAAGSQLFDSTAVTFPGGINGTQMLVAISLQNAGGGDITWHLDGFAVGASGSTGLSGTISGTAGAVQYVKPNRDGTLTQTVMGHCVVLTEYTQLNTLFIYTNPYGFVTGALNAWAGEPAGIRFARLCGEESVQFRSRGNLNSTVLVGAQTAQTLAQLLQECADADRGVWYELRQQLGWGYITRAALYSQAAQVTADYDQNHLGMWTSDPTRDDQVIVNDVTITQTAGGSSSRAYAAPGQPVAGGRLSTLSPAAGGCGTYDQEYSLNLYRAGDLDSEASWLVHAGTVDQRRFPGIALDLTNRDLASLFWSVLDMDLGDRLVIDNPPPRYGYDPVSQLAQQVTETLWYDTLTVAVCGVPELPYEVAVASTARADTAGSQLHTSYSSSATSFSVDVTAGNLWITTAAFSSMFPFDIGIAGERITVTAITGSSSPQTFTVTRAVNGVAKAQASGAAVALWNTPVAAL